MGMIDELEQLRRIQSMNTTETFDRAFHSLEALYWAIISGGLLYGTSLYVDANPAVGDDANPGTEALPFLTIQAAVNAAAEYTTIICADSRVGALAVGFDENVTVNGVVIDTNYITIIGTKLFGDRGFSGGIPITNTIASADHIFSGAGIGVAIVGFDIVLPNTIGDEETINLTGDGVFILSCDIINPVGTPGFRGIVLAGNDCHIRRCHLRLFDDDAIRLDACLMTHIEENIIAGAATTNGIHFLNGCLGNVAEHNDIFANNVGILIDVGATYTSICNAHFANNTTDYTNNGGATNHLIYGHIQSQIAAGQTQEEDIADIYNRIGGASTEATYALPNDLVENTAFTIPASTPDGQKAFIILDLSNLVQNADIRIRYDVHGDGAAFPIMETFNWTVAMDDVVYFREISGQRAITVTVQSTIAQGAIMDIDYEYVLG